MQFRDLISKIGLHAEARRTVRTARDLAAGALKVIRSGPIASQELIEGLTRAEDEIARAHATWIEPSDLDGSTGGKFDVCDLRFWLALAERADVPAIPGKTICTLHEAELEAVLPRIDVPGRQLPGILADAAERDMEASSADDKAAIMGRLESALEDIPWDWMVRTHLGGSSRLKELVGTGLMRKGDDVAQVAPGLAFGAGWVYVGNRRLIDYANDRFVSLAPGHKPETHYIARPWFAPARFHHGEDLHRKGSPIAGPGVCPAEWRVFVRNGKVTGVANYYGWTGEGATPENAWNALNAAALAQKIVDAAFSLHLIPAALRADQFRKQPRLAHEFRRFDVDGFHATLDFLESEKGMVLLEGGPGHYIGAGGHPCAFAGQGVDPANPGQHVADCEGVAYRNMAHVDLGAPETWLDGDTTGAIEGWEAAVARAREFAAFTEDMDRLVESFELTQTSLEPH